MNRRSFAALLAAAATVPALTACGTLRGSENRAAPSQPQEIRVGAMPIVGAIPLHYGVDKDVFDRHGLSVTTTRIRSGGVSLSLLSNGELDIMFGNYVSFIAAHASGLDVRIVAEGSRAARNNFAIVVLPGSPLGAAADLMGQRVGVNALNNIATLTVSSTLRDRNIDPSSVHFVEFGFPDMIAALKRGDVDAAFLPEPFLTKAARTLGARRLLDPCSGANENLPIDGYAVTGEFAQRNPKIISAFERGLREAKESCADRSVATKEIEKVTRVDHETAALVSQSVYPDSLNPIALQRVADLMRDFGVLDKHVAMSTMLASV